MREDLSAHPVEERGPAFHGDALEHCQHGVKDVVKRRYAKVRTLKQKNSLKVIITSQTVL